MFALTVIILRTRSKEEARLCVAAKCVMSHVRSVLCIRYHIRLYGYSTLDILKRICTVYRVYPYAMHPKIRNLSPRWATLSKKGTRRSPFVLLFV
jgi:hypothetical protein